MRFFVGTQKPRHWARLDRYGPFERLTGNLSTEGQSRLKWPFLGFIPLG